ncbi:NUDIX hydrolase, partial [Vibrio sp. 1942]
CCAQRELEEETGFSAEKFTPLGQVTPLAGFCDEIQYLFVAEHLAKTNRYECDDDEVIEVVTLSREQLEEKIIDGTITDAKTIACLSKARLCGYI